MENSEKMKEQIEEMARDLANHSFFYNGGCMMNYSLTAKLLYNAGYRKQKEVELREEVTTDDFHDLELAKERGYHRKKFYCPNCDLLIKTETWDSKRMFGYSTVLKTNEMPKFCPNCGAHMRGGKNE